MPLPERTYRHVDTTRSTTIATMEQFLRGGESSKMSPTYSPTTSSPSSPYFERLKNHDLEEDQALYQKKSVLTKVKERARKFRNSLSKKKQEDGNLTPSWGVSLEDEEEEEDAEYLGAPIYESELAPEEYKENARQHPRANPVISEKRVLRTNVNSGVEQDREKLLISPAKSTTTTRPATTTTAAGPKMTMTETIAEKLTPTNAEGSYAAHSVASKIRAVSRNPAADMSSQTSSAAPLASSIPSPMQNSSSSSLSLSGKYTSPKGASVKDYLVNNCEPGNNEKTSSVVPLASSIQNSSSSYPSLSGKNTSPRGASVKDYLMNNCEPGNNERTTSQVTSEPMSPRRAPGNAGVMERVRGAVNSLLRNEEPSQQKYVVKTPTTRASPQITDAQQVGQEENHGRILQAN